MAKKRERSETEFLRGLVRELKSELRHLKRKNNSNNKKLRGFEQLVGDPEEDAIVFETKLPDRLKCPDCGEQVEVVDLFVRELHLCTGCDFRKTYPKKK